MSAEIRMLPLSTRDTVPLALDHDGREIVYHLRVPSIAERQRFRRDVIAAGAHYPGESELYDAMREDVRALIHPDDVDRLLALIDACDAEQDALLAGGDATAIVGADGARTMRLLERELRRAGAAYAALVADRSYYVEIATVMAAGRFLDRVDGLDIALERRGSVLSDAALDALPAGHAAAIGLKALGLLRPDRSAQKNSPSSPNTHTVRASSPAAKSRQKACAAGGSAGRSTSRTRSSRSTRNGSSS